MKRVFTILAAVLLTATIWAQSPQKMSYQAVIRDASNHLVTTQIGMRISILQSTSTGTAVYVETQTPTPNANGLVTIEINGSLSTVTLGPFSAIDWSAGPYYIKTETAVATPLTTYTIEGTSQILSVPYALYAAKVANLSGTNTGDETTATIKTKLGITTLSGSNTGDQTLSGLGGVASNTAITGETKTKITYDTKGLVTAGENATTADIAASTNKNYVTDAQLTVIGNTSGTNTGDNAVNTNYSGLVNYTHPTGDGNLHVPATGTINNGKVLTAGATAGSLSWVTPTGQTPGTVAGQMQYWNGSAWVTVAPGSPGQTLTFINGVPVWIGTPLTNVVANPTTGKIWMDRNLGATQVATSSSDAASYGYLYQWGRGTDGHQIRTSVTTISLSNTDAPGNVFFILAPDSPWDWRSPQNTSLWQGVSGVNNPCPAGYRIPTETELNAERLSWSSNNAAGAFASPLKFSVAGNRIVSDGSLNNVGIGGFCWSSTIDGIYSRGLGFISGNAFMFPDYRANGYSVRCIKE